MEAITWWDVLVLNPATVGSLILSVAATAASVTWLVLHSRIEGAKEARQRSEEDRARIQGELDNCLRASAAPSAGREHQLPPAELSNRELKACARQLALDMRDLQELWFATRLADHSSPPQGATEEQVAAWSAQRDIDRAVNQKLARQAYTRRRKEVDDVVKELLARVDPEVLARRNQSIEQIYRDLDWPMWPFSVLADDLELLAARIPP